MRRVEADSFPPFLKVWLLAGRYLHDRYLNSLYARAQNLRRALAAQVDQALAQVDLLVMPTTPQVAPVLLDEPSDDFTIVGRGTTMIANTAPTNLSGHPSLAVPTGLDADGLPTSIQIVGRRFDDTRSTIRAGAVVEAAVGALPPRSPAARTCRLTPLERPLERSCPRVGTHDRDLPSPARERGSRDERGPPRRRPSRPTAR